MELLLKPVEKPSSTFVYRDQRKFTCADYGKLSELLAESLMQSDRNHQLMTDWTYTPTHPLVFEIALKEKTLKTTTDFLMRYVDLVFLDVLQKYIHLPEVTLLLAMSRNRTSGLRIHVVGVELSHDDYVRLCELMEFACQYEEGDLAVRLRIPDDFPLPSCARPNEELYVPVRLIRVHFGFHQEDGVWQARRLDNITWQSPEEDDSFFSRIVHSPVLWKEMARAMMPVPQPDATYLHYRTYIGKGKNWVAQIKSHLNDKHYAIMQEDVLTEGKGFCYEFLKNNATHIHFVYGYKYLLRDWYNRFRNESSPLEVFVDVDLKLRQQCPHLQHEESPLTKVLKAFERPVYYALCNQQKRRTDVNKIRKQFPFLSEDLPSIPPPEARHLTMETILHCAYRTGEGFLEAHVLKGAEWIVGSIQTLDELIEQVRWFQERVYPVIDGPESLYAWDPLENRWFALQEPTIELASILQSIVQVLDGRVKLPAEVLDSFNEELTLQKIVKDWIGHAEQKGKVEGNVRTEPAEVYGDNVPEYYFLEEVDKTMTRLENAEE